MARILQGRVLDENGDPIVAAHVYVPATGRSQVSDARGSFRLRLPPGPHRLGVTRIGYRSAEVDVLVPARDIVVRLASRDLGLPPVRVRATRHPVQTTRPGHYVLEPTRLAQQIGSLEDVMRSVQSLPGVKAASDLHGDFFVRGSGSHANSIFIDGIEVFFPYHILGLNSIFNPGLIEHVEFYSGGAPAEYGDATGGVLAIRSRGASRSQERASIGLSYLSGQVRVAGDGSSFGGVVSLRRSYHDKLLELVGSSSGRQVPVFHDAFLRGRWQPSTQDLIVGGVLHAGDGLSLSAPETLGQDLDLVAFEESDGERPDLRSFAALDDRLRIRNRLTVASLYWRRVLGPNAFLETTFGYVPQDFEFSLRGNNRESAFIQGRTASIRQDLTWHTGDHEVRVGYTSYRDHTHRRVSAWAGILDLLQTNSPLQVDDIQERHEIDERRTRKSMAFYVQDEWTLPELPVVLKNGFRYEHDGLTGEHLLSPRFAAEWRLGPRWSLHGTWGAYQGLRNKPMEVMPVENGGVLGSERSTEATLGGTAELRPELRLGVSGYLKRMSRLAYESAPASYSTGGIGRAHGLEAWMRLGSGGKPFRARLRYTLAFARSLDPRAWRRRPHPEAQPDEPFWAAVYETPYWYAPRQDERHALDFDGSWQLGRWEFGARYQLGSGRPYTPVVDVATDTEGRKYGIVGRKGSARYPAYRRLDVRLLRHLETRGVPWSFYIDVLNATGADNVYQYRYDPQYRNRYAVKMLPRLPTLGIQAHF